MGFDAGGGTTLPYRDLNGRGLVSALSRDRRIEARKQSQPSRSKLDAHEAFILGLIEKAPDITLAEIRERLVDQRGVRAAPSTVWLFLDRRGVTFKSKLKALLRKAVTSTVDDLWSAAADCLSACTPQECRHYFEAAGYDPD